MDFQGQIYEANLAIRQSRLQPQELEDLVKRAQNLEQKAIDTLCQEYAGMLKGIAVKSAVRTILGYEDALQSAYMYFLMIVHAYKGNRYDVLPGLFYLAVVRSLYKEIKNTLGYMNSVSYLEEGNNDPEDLSYEDLLEDPQALLAMERVDLEQLLSKLDPKEQAVLRGCFFEDKTRETLVKELAYTDNQVKYYKKQGILHLHYLLLKPKQGGRRGK